MLFLIVAVIITNLLSYSAYRQERYSVSPEQHKLLDEIKNLPERGIEKIEIEQYDTAPKTFKKFVSKPSEITTVKGFLAKANTMPFVGDHVHSVDGYTITFIYNNGKELKVLADIYSDKPADAYLATNFYSPEKGRVYMKPIYVPGFGTWLVNAEPKGEL